MLMMLKTHQQPAVQNEPISFSSSANQSDFGLLLGSMLDEQHVNQDQESVEENKRSENSPMTLEKEELREIFADLGVDEGWKEILAELGESEGWNALFESFHNFLSVLNLSELIEEIDLQSWQNNDEIREIWTEFPSDVQQTLYLFFMDEEYRDLQKFTKNEQFNVMLFFARLSDNHTALSRLLTQSEDNATVQNAINFLSEMKVQIRQLLNTSGFNETGSRQHFMHGNVLENGLYSRSIKEKRLNNKVDVGQVVGTNDSLIGTKNQVKNEEFLRGLLELNAYKGNGNKPSSEGKVETPALKVEQSNQLLQVPHELQAASRKNEQLTIHLGEQLPRELQQKQFLRQFQNLLHHAQLSQTKDGVQSLTVKLHPEHLGRLEVQLTQMNGLLSAKILVSQTLTKELIESQISQLRQAFIQQQLPVEKLEIMQQQSQFEREKEGSTSEQQQHDSNEEKNDESKDFHDELQDFLYSINEQV
ncbi:flagellar hook-length control protein FliK [Bacillus sp. JCM 19034]|uniref:flagellar hook-length control protein FliK n=1 Tax=Bacillus sp. JCM 19034 TaxID=1481928 RepID=UPI001E437CB5|nr:flagellar hook-length control protein FliK [Bacillus sp. JCM 19034]